MRDFLNAVFGHSPPREAREAGASTDASRQRNRVAAMIVTRFAPSPTGYLHLGHVRSAWEGWHAAREIGGRFLLRIEDIDRGRCRPEFDAAIREDLAWLGFDWDGAVRRQ